MDYFITREKIFDLKKEVFAYGLEFTENKKKLEKTLKEDQKASKILTDTFHLFGLNNVTDGKPAVVPITKNLLISEFAKMFPAEQIVLLINNDVEVDLKVVQACKDLKEEGYKLCLDDFSFQANRSQLLEYTSMVRVNWNTVGDFIKKQIIKRLKPRDMQCVANGIDNSNTYRRAITTGFEYFQGRLFDKPEIINKKEIPANKAIPMQMMKEISKPEFDFAHIEKIIKKDASIIYKLMRLINSAGLGTRNEIKSIHQALVMLGENEVKRWITLLILSNINEGQPGDCMVRGLVRGRMMEVLAEQAGLKENAQDLFLTGLFSMMDKMMMRPLKIILEDIPFEDNIKNTLLKQETPYQKLFQLVIGFEKEKNVNDLLVKFKLSNEELATHKKEAEEWVNKIDI